MNFLFLDKNRTKALCGAVCILLIALQVVLSWKYLFTYAYLSEKEAIDLVAMDVSSFFPDKVVKSKFPYALTQVVKQVTTPELSRGLIPLLWAMISTLIAISLIGAQFRMLLGYLLAVSLSFHWVYFLGAGNVDLGLVLVLLLLATKLVRKVSLPSRNYILGLILGSALWINPLALILVIPFLIINMKELQGRFKEVFIGAVPLLMLVGFKNFTLLSSNFHNKSLMTVTEDFIFIMDYIFHPYHLFSQVVSQKSLPLILSWQAGGLILMALITIFHLLSKENFLRLMMAFYLFVISASVMVSDREEPMMALISLGFCFFATVVFSLAQFPQDKSKQRMVLIFGGSFILGQLVLWINLNTFFAKISKDQPHCAWTYQCMVQDMNWQGISVLALDELDIGQFEYFSNLKVRPQYAIIKNSSESSYEIVDKAIQANLGRKLVLVVTDSEIFSLLADRLKRSYNFQLLKDYQFPNLGRNHKVFQVSRHQSI